MKLGRRCSFQFRETKDSVRSRPDPDLLMILRSRTRLMPKVGLELYFGIPTELGFLLPFGIGSLITLTGSWPITSTEEIS